MNPQTQVNTFRINKTKQPNKDKYLNIVSWLAISGDRAPVIVAKCHHVSSGLSERDQCMSATD